MNSYSSNHCGNLESQLAEKNLSILGLNSLFIFRVTILLSICNSPFIYSVYFQKVEFWGFLRPVIFKWHKASRVSPTSCSLKVIHFFSSSFNLSFLCTFCYHLWIKPVHFWIYIFRMWQINTSFQGNPLYVFWWPSDTEYLVLSRYSEALFF